MRIAGNQLEHLKISADEIDTLREHVQYCEDFDTDFEDENEDEDVLFSNPEQDAVSCKTDEYPECGKMIAVRRCAKCGNLFDVEIGSKRIYCEDCEPTEGDATAKKQRTKKIFQFSYSTIRKLNKPLYK